MYAKDDFGEIEYKYAYLDNNTRYATYDLISGDVKVEQNGITTEYNINDKEDDFHSYAANSHNGTNEVVEGFNITTTSENHNGIIETNQNLVSINNSDTDTSLNNNSKIADEFDEFGRLSKRTYYNNSNDEVMHAVYTYLDTSSKYYIEPSNYTPMNNIAKTANELQGNDEDSSNEIVCQSNLIRSLAYYDSEDNRIIEYRCWYDEYGNLVSSTAIGDTENEEGIDFIISSKGYEYESGKVTVEALLVENGNAPNIKYSYNYDELGNITEIQSESLISFGSNPKTSVKGFAYDKNAKYLLTAAGADGIENVFVGTDDNGNIESFFGKDYAYSKGNKLVGFVNGDNSAEYTYNLNGLLKLKSNTVESEDGTTNSTYKYFWNNEKLSFVKLTSTSDSDGATQNWDSYISILKDNNDSPYGFLYIDSDKNITEYYYVFDGVGNIMGIVDGNGTLSCRYEYDALGNVTCFDIEKPIFGENEISFMDINPLLSKSYLYDNTSKLYINKNSCYSPEIGKTTTQNLNFYTRSNVFDCNPYEFCGNNFITKVSADGLDSKYTVDDLNSSIVSKSPMIDCYGIN